MEQLTDRFLHERYVVRRKVFKIFGGAFHIYGPEGEVLFYSRMKAFKLKEDIRLYSGEDMQTEVLSIQARQIIDWSAAYDVFDPIDNMKVGALRRKGLKSMVRDEWLLLDTEDREIGRVTEDSAWKAAVRRLVESASVFMPQSYHGYVGESLVCMFKQNFNPFVLKVALDFSADEQLLLDRRLGIAAAVLLCAVEGRQG